MKFTAYRSFLYVWPFDLCFKSNDAYTTNCAMLLSLSSDVTKVLSLTTSDY
jgi:hypothetical protein